VKECSSCRLILPEDKFNPRRGSGLQSKCIDCNKEYLKEYYKRNKLKILKQRRSYSRSNKLVYKSNLYRGVTYNAFKYKNINFGGRAHALLGATWREVSEYFELKFEDYMSWDKPETWAIDHIRPLSKAKDLEDLRERCHYTNLQPLHPEINRMKSDLSPLQWDKKKLTKRYKDLICKIKKQNSEN
jgi:hypothetical protein